MAKEKKVKKAKIAKVRKIALAEYVKKPFDMTYNMDGKLLTFHVLDSGIITYKEKEYFTPNGAACGVAKMLGLDTPGIDAWLAFKYELDGAQVPLNALRGKYKAKSRVTKIKKAKKTQPKARKAARRISPKAQSEQLEVASTDVSVADSQVVENEENIPF